MRTPMLFGDTAELFEALCDELDCQRRQVRRRRLWRLRSRLLRRAWREVRRGRLAACCAGVWIAWALVRTWESMK